jgi:hypothetical protein
LFVAHEGQKQLDLREVGTIDTVDFGIMAQRMTELVAKNILDPTLRDWIIPDFSTTIHNDKVVASIVMMGTLKGYFKYRFSISCGLPSVTLLGEKSDWEALLARIDRLPSFGEEPKQWHALLKPVLTRFVRTFDEPHSAETKDFWQRIAHFENGGSGPTWLSGWITAFCFWDEKGKRLGGTFS